MDPKFMAPQSRWVIKTLFKRDFDTFIDSAKTRVNQTVLAADVVLAMILIRWII